MTSANHPYTTLKAFTTSREAGNPAAVVLLPPADPALASTKDGLSHFPPDSALAKAANTINLPMTAFLLPASDSSAKNGEYALRWFNPSEEAWLCGHATVALSSYIFSQPDSPKILKLETIRHGQVTSSLLPNPLDGSGQDKRVAIDFPEIVDFEDVARDSKRWNEVVEALKSASNAKELPVVAIKEKTEYLIIEFDSAFDMSAGALPFDTESMTAFDNTHVLLTQVATNASSSAGPHIHSRVLNIYPGFRVEDAATGSAHCAIIPYHLSKPNAKSTFDATAIAKSALAVKQLSAETGEMVVQWRKQEGRVRIFGKAVELGKGEVELVDGTTS